MSPREQAEECGQLVAFVSRYSGAVEAKEECRHELALALRQDCICGHFCASTCEKKSLSASADSRFMVARSSGLGACDAATGERLLVDDEVDIECRYSSVWARAFTRLYALVRLKRLWWCIGEHLKEVKARGQLLNVTIEKELHGKDGSHQ